MPYILYIALLCRPWHQGIPYFLYIALLCRPWHQGIPYFLYIKGRIIYPALFNDEVPP